MGWIAVALLALGVVHRLGRVGAGGELEPESGAPAASRVYTEREVARSAPGGQSVATTCGKPARCSAGPTCTGSPVCPAGPVSAPDRKARYARLRPSPASSRIGSAPSNSAR